MMDAFRAFGPQVLALLAAGLLSSLGLTWVARRPSGVAFLARLRGRTLALALATVAAACGYGAYALLRAFVSGGTPEPSALTPPRLFALGLFVGVPLGMPGIVLAWSEARARRRKRTRDHVPTKDERRAYAADLERQIREVSTEPRAVAAKIGGDGGRVLILEGDIRSDEGERLTRALRADLAELGFKRVEGKGVDDWWSRV
jgi:hypothetical protein